MSEILSETQTTAGYLLTYLLTCFTTFRCRRENM